MNKLLLLLTLAPCIAFGQTTLIPDTNFEQALIDLGYDTGTPDGSVPTVNISSVDSLYVGFLGISDLTGIEDFAALTTLACNDNQLTSLDLSGATALTYLICWKNQLTSLYVSANTALSYMECGFNYLTSLDVSNNTALTTLYCGDNELTNLDVSNCTALEYLWCHDNQLTCLNVKNGNNISMINFNFTATDNPNLTCIEVDDVAWSTNAWTYIDSQTSFSTDCNNPCSSPTGITELPTPNNHLLFITDILGRTTQPVPNTLLFYIYDDGSVEKRIQLER